MSDIKPGDRVRFLTDQHRGVEHQGVVLDVSDRSISIDDPEDGFSTRWRRESVLYIEPVGAAAQSP